jgi:anti-sigma factor RsiW
VIEKLENNEQVLLMYLAGELPAEDHEEVDQMLSVDTALQSELSLLLDTQNFVNGKLSLLDDISPMRVTVDFAARQVGREIRQRQANPRIPARVAKPEQPARSWRWLYPTTAAASIAILLMIWLGHQATSTNSPYSQSPRLPSFAVADQSETTNLLMESLQGPVGTDAPDAKAAVATDDDSRQVALGDAMPQDEISQYLLNANAGGN